MFNFCIHKYDKGQEDGYQYCGKCGKARAIPKRDCEHVWKERASSDKTNCFGNVCGYLFVLKCSKCGDIKKEEINIG